MPERSGIGSEAQAKFRLGFVLGVDAALLALDGRLRDTDRLALRDWLEELRDWQSYGGEDGAPDAPELD